MYRIGDLLVSLKAALEHTCMHQEEPIYTQDCFEHIKKEIRHIMNHIRKLQSEIAISVPEAIWAEDGLKLYNRLSYIMKELDDLHEDLRHPDHQHVHHYMTHIEEARKEIHKLYDNIVHEFAPKELKEFYTLEG
jgi:hypothetical protein